MKAIRTHRDIPFAPHQLWPVLADFDRYADWNPLNVWAAGQPHVGARVPMRFVDAGGGRGKIIAQTVTVTRCDPDRYLEWVGHIPLLFTGRHFFELQPAPRGTRLTHGEDLSGIIPAFFSPERIARQKAAYDAFNEALENRVKQVSARS